MKARQQFRVRFCTVFVRFLERLKIFKIKIGGRSLVVRKQWYQKRLTTKEHQGTFWSDGNLCLDHGCGYATKFIELCTKTE